MVEPYLTPDDIRAIFPVLGEADHPDPAIELLVAEFEEIAERARGCAFRVRERVYKVTSTGCGTAVLPDPFVVEVTAVTVDETAADVSGLHPVGSDGLLTGGTWGAGRRLVITYDHGLEDPPPAILRACSEFVRAKRLAQVGNQPRNTLSYQDDSGYTFRESTADWSAGRYTGLMVVDDAINSVPDHRIPGIA